MRGIGEMKSKNAVGEQLSLFGLTATDRMREQPAGQIMIDMLEITEPPKYLVQYGKDQK
jgi:hypothetical protein